MGPAERDEKPRTTGLVHPILGSIVLNNNTIYILSESMVWSLPTYSLHQGDSQLTAVASMSSIALSPQPSTLVGTTNNNNYDNGFLIMDKSFKPQQFIIASSQWSPSAPSTTPVTNTKSNNTFVGQELSTRTEHATAVSMSGSQPKVVFVHGGRSMLNGTANATCATDSFWSYHLLQHQWTQIKISNNDNNNNSNYDFGSRYGHTMSMLR